MLTDSDFSFFGIENVEVIYNGYDRVVSAGLNDIPDLLDQKDPRYDDYLKSLSAFFTASEGEQNLDILYIKKSRSSFLFFLSILNIMSNYEGHWFFADFNLYVFIFCAAFFIVSWAFIPVSGLLRLKWVLLSGVPWFMSLISAIPDLMFTGCLLFLLSVCTLGRIQQELANYLSKSGSQRTKSFKFFPGKSIMLLLFSLLFVVLLAVFNRNTRIILLSALFMSLSTAVVAITMIFFELRNKYFRKPGLFWHEFLISRGFPVKQVTRKQFLQGTIALFLLIFPLFEYTESIITLPPLPGPVVFEGIENFSQPDIKKLAEQEGDSIFPDISDYLTHMAFQEAFTLGRDYTFPEIGEIISQNRYIKTGNGFSVQNIIVREFTENWYWDILKTHTKPGIEDLLLAEKRPVGVALKSAHSNRFPLLRILVWVIVSATAIWRVLIFKAE